MKSSQMPLRKGEDASYSAALHVLLESLVMCPSAPPRELIEHVISRVETTAFLCFRGPMNSQIWCCKSHWTLNGASRKHIQYSALRFSVLDFIKFYPKFKQFSKFKKFRGIDMLFLDQQNITSKCQHTILALLAT